MICFLTSRTDLSGKEELNPSNRFIDELRRCFPRPCRALDVCSDPDGWEKTDLYASLTRLYFENAGFVFERFDTLDGRNEAQAAEMVKGSNLYGGGFINYTSPAIEPLYESKDDVTIISEVARALDLDDELLKGGYDPCAKYIFRDLPVDLDEVKAKHLPVQIRIDPPKNYFDLKLETPSGKIELYSNTIAKYEQSHGLDPLPEYQNGDGEGDFADYPMTLMLGSRQANAIHSRLHELSWPRSLRPDPMVQINPDDADKYGLKQGDDLYLVTVQGRVKVKADVTNVSNMGELNFFHGYSEANANSLLQDTFLDPYSGFPGYKQVRCRVEKA